MTTVKKEVEEEEISQENKNPDTGGDSAKTTKHQGRPLKEKESPLTTAWNQKEKRGLREKCEEGARVKVMGKDFYHVLTYDDQ